MWILSVYRPIGHLIVSGQMRFVLTGQKPGEEILGPCVIRNTPAGGWLTATSGMYDILCAHGADFGPIDPWDSNTPAEIVGRADITQHGEFPNTPENILRATSLSITTLTAGEIEVLLGPFINVPYFLRLENVRVVRPPVPLRRQYVRSKKTFAFLADEGIRRQVGLQTGEAAPILEPEVVV